MVDVAIQQQADHIYRVNLKQSAKGIWYGEFTVRANTPEELKDVVSVAEKTVKDFLTVNNPEELKNE